MAGFDGSLYLFAIRADENPQSIPIAAVDGVREYARHMAPELPFGSTAVTGGSSPDDLRRPNKDYRIDALPATGLGRSIDEL